MNASAMSVSLFNKRKCKNLLIEAMSPVVALLMVVNETPTSRVTDIQQDNVGVVKKIYIYCNLTCILLYTSLNILGSTYFLSTLCMAERVGQISRKYTALPSEPIPNQNKRIINHHYIFPCWPTFCNVFLLSDALATHY